MMSTMSAKLRRGSLLSKRMLKIVCWLGGLTFVGSAGADVISVNFGSNSGSVSGTADVGLVAGVAGNTWNNLSAGVGTNSTLRSVDQTAVAGCTLTWTCKNLYNYTSGITDAFLKGYLDDTEDKISISLTGIPFAYYDVIVYMASDNASKKFGAVALNGRTYYYDAATARVRADYVGGTSWGATRAATATLGTNALRVNGLGGSTLTIKPAAQNYSVYRCSIAAIQIVENTGGTCVLAPDLAWSGESGVAPSGWFSKWTGQCTGEYKRLGPLNKEVVCTRSERAPYASVTWPTAFTMCLYADISDAWSDQKDVMLLDLGNVSKGSSDLVLLRNKNTDNVELVYVNGTGAGAFTKTSTSVTLSDVGAGYHLFFVTFSTAGGISLRVDNRAAVSLSTGALGALTANFQLGDTHGGAATAVAAPNMGVAGLWGWNRVLTDAEMDEVLHFYTDGRVGDPMRYDWNASLTAASVKTMLPTMTGAGNRYLGFATGDVYILTNRVVSVPQLRMGVTQGANPRLNIAGTLNITSTSTTQWVANELDSCRGSVLANKASTTCSLTVNPGGAFNSPHAYVCLNQNCNTSSQLFTLDGGTARVRGFNTGNGSGLITVKNGALLEIADFHNGNQTLWCGAGTIRAIPYTNAAPTKVGWTHPATSACSFNDTATGTTIDVNGLTNTLASSITGSGRLVVADSSADKTGKLVITQMPSFAGTIVVEDGVALDIGANRPYGTFQFGANSRLILRESLGDTNGIAKISFTGSPLVTFYRADGTTLVSDAAVVSDEGDAPFIRYTPAATPLVSGEGCWLDFEFDNYSYTSVGYNKLTLYREGDNGIGKGVTNGDFKDASSIYAASQVYMTVGYPTEWTAAIYATVPNYPDAAVMTFGTCTGGLIGLIGGATDNEVKLVRTTGNSAYITLATMSVPNAATAQHLYAFIKRATSVEVYLDGVLWQTYDAGTAISIGSGFQMASVHGSTGATGIKRFGAPDITGGLENEILTASYVGMLRMYDTALNARALATLADEFPYISPNGLYARTLAAGTNAWTAADAWTLMAEQVADRTTAAAPVVSAALQIAGDAAGTSALAVDLADETRFESVTVGGAGAVRFVRGANAGVAVNEGKTVLNVDTTIEYGTLSVSGGPLTLADGKTLTFDWSAYPTDHTTPNQTIQLTGVTTASAIAFIPPTNALDRTFTCAYNAGNRTWSVTIARPAYTLAWTGRDDDSVWDAATLWRNTATDGVAAFLAGDATIFPDTAKASELITASGTKNGGAMTFTANTTRYVLTGGTLNIASISCSGTAPVAVSNTINLTTQNALAYGPASVAFNDFRTWGHNDITLADAATLTPAIFRNGSVSNNYGAVTCGANRALTFAAARGDAIDRIYGAITLPASSSFLKTGSGDLRLGAHSPAFRGTLAVDGGRLVLAANLSNMTATAEHPVRVADGGRLYVEQNGQGVANALGRLPSGAHVDVSGRGVFEVLGYNPFPRADTAGGVGPTVTAHDGGIVQFDGMASWHDIRVHTVNLADSTLQLCGTNANWGGYAVQLESGVLTSGGTSEIKNAGTKLGTIKVATLAVTNGTLTLNAKTSKDAPLVKTGAGTLVLGASGVPASGALEIAAGTVVANAALGQVPTLTLGAGTVLDVSALETTFAASNVVVAAGTTATVATGTRELTIGEKVVAWPSAPAGRVRLASPRHRTYALVAKPDGLYVQDGGMLFILR